MNTKTQSTTSPVLLIIFWLYVGIPLVLGIWETLIKAGALFK
ncbi:MFS transporter small subunit [Allopusillimonas ginsengisoli]|nr:oxalate:formate antiporter [Allopusillimonas ginsengisoli]TEA77503.1 oxalate:formate antiporter [Allopusillimonas ginsengisoli]